MPVAHRNTRPLVLRGARWSPDQRPLRPPLGRNSASPDPRLKLVFTLSQSLTALSGVETNGASLMPRNRRRVAEHTVPGAS